MRELPGHLITNRCHDAQLSQHAYAYARTCRQACGRHTITTSVAPSDAAGATSLSKLTPLNVAEASACCGACFLPLSSQGCHGCLHAGCCTPLSPCVCSLMLAPPGQGMRGRHCECLVSTEDRCLCMSMVCDEQACLQARPWAAVLLLPWTLISQPGQLYTSGPHHGEHTVLLCAAPPFPPPSSVEFDYSEDAIACTANEAVYRTRLDVNATCAGSRHAQALTCRSKSSLACEKTPGCTLRWGRALYEVRAGDARSGPTSQNAGDEASK